MADMGYPSDMISHLTWFPGGPSLPPDTAYAIATARKQFE